MMKIKDLNGKEITVTDLNAAIVQAEMFKAYRQLALPLCREDSIDHF